MHLTLVRWGSLILTAGMAKKCLTLKCLNPFISTTSSKPPFSPGSWMTQHYYLLFIIYDPATTDLIFIKLIIYQGPGVGAYSSFLNLFVLSGSRLPCGLTLAEVIIYPGGQGRRYTANFSTH